MKEKKQIILNNIKRIKQWVEKDDNRRFPYSHAENEEERRLSGLLNYIKNTIVKTYIYMSENEKIEYKNKYPEIDEIITILQDTNKSIITSRLTNMKEIQEWVERTGSTKFPTPKSKDEEEKELGTKYGIIKYKFLNLYKKLETEEEREEYRLIKHPDFQSIIDTIQQIEIIIIKNYLPQARIVMEWIENTGYDNRLTPYSSNDELRDFSTKFYDMKENINKICNNWTKEQKEIYMTEYPELKEVFEIIEKIDTQNISKYLRNAREIKSWSESVGENKPPKITIEDEEERQMGEKLHSIRDSFLKPYYMLGTEEEKSEYRKKYPHLEEIIKIVEEMDKNNLHPYLANARNIKEWSNQNKRLPHRSSNNEGESQLATQLKSIRYYFIKPYLILDEKGQEKYRVENPEIDEVLKIVSSLDAKYGTKRKRELATLIIEDIKKERKLKEAKQLKEQYEHQLEKKNEQQEEK